MTRPRPFFVLFFFLSVVVSVSARNWKFVKATGDVPGVRGAAELAKATDAGNDLIFLGRIFRMLLCHCWLRSLFLHRFIFFKYQYFGLDQY